VQDPDGDLTESHVQYANDLRGVQEANAGILSTMLPLTGIDPPDMRKKLSGMSI
jgi:hypothetical protein